MNKFNVYDEVWIMESEKPTKKIVFAVIESMDLYKTGTDIYYRLASSQASAGWENSEGIYMNEECVSKTPKGLILSLENGEKK